MPSRSRAAKVCASRRSARCAGPAASGDDAGVRAACPHCGECTGAGAAARRPDRGRPMPASSKGCYRIIGCNHERNLFPSAAMPRNQVPASTPAATVPACAGKGDRIAVAQPWPDHRRRKRSGSPGWQWIETRLRLADTQQEMAKRLADSDAANKENRIVAKPGAGSGGGPAGQARPAGRQTGRVAEPAGLARKPLSGSGAQPGRMGAGARSNRA